MHSTLFIDGYMASDMWLRSTEIKRGNQPPPLYGLEYVRVKLKFVLFNETTTAH